MLEKEGMPEDESELEREVHKIIAEATERENRIIEFEKERNKKTKSCLRNAATYFIFGCAEVYFASDFAIASLTPIEFGNVKYSLILGSGAIVNAVISYLCLSKSIKQLKLYDEVRNEPYIS